MTNYLLAGGGTAGHVNPLLALADVISEHEADDRVWALGTATGLEARLVPLHGLELLTIERLPFPRKPSLYALKFPIRFSRAVKEVRGMIRDLGIDVVVGFGGFASTPAYVAAKLEKIPFVIHEANALPGLANKLGAKMTRHIGVTFANTPMDGAVVTGMPLRTQIVEMDRERSRNEAQALFGLDPDTPTLLVTGGSLGARAINEGIGSQMDAILAAGVQVLHIWGRTPVTVTPRDGYRVLEYCDRMDLALAAADLAVSRAGSTTVSELCGLGIPTVFVPYRVGNGEQAFNAHDAVEAGGAMLVEDSEITPEWVANVLLPLIRNREALAEMSQAQQRVGSLDGAEKLYELVCVAREAR